ncbi:MAG: carboxypeptidase-like regulatory domain-containing protein [Dehalococcoidia bacterium]|nr:carboxypeptidase-like regulatory domain-containing protein [Dehalococcoidia bacterium]
MNAVSGGPDNLLVYYEASSVALSSQTGPEATIVFTFTSTSSPGNYFINVLNPTGAPSTYNLRIDSVGGGSGAPGSNRSSAIMLNEGQVSPPQVFTGPPMWFAYNYPGLYQPASILMEGSTSLVFDVFFGQNATPIGTSYPTPSGQTFNISSAGSGMYYAAARSNGYIPPPISIPFTMKGAAAAGGPVGGGALGDQYNPQRLESDQPAANILSPGRNYWYSYDIPIGLSVKITLIQADLGIALNVSGFAQGVRTWTVPPFFGQPTVLINVAAPNGGSYTIEALTTLAVAGDGTAKDKALSLPAEFDQPGALSTSISRVWYVYQHNGSTDLFTLKDPQNPSTPSTGKMDIFVGDSSFPQPGSGGNSGFVGGGTPPGPIYIVVYRTDNGTTPLGYLLNATSQTDFTGGGGGGFSMPSTSLKAGVMACEDPSKLVPNGRVAVMYNGQIIFTTQPLADGKMDILPSALPNGGQDGHYDLKGLPATGADPGSAGANCVAGNRVGVDINGGLVNPPGGPYGQTLMLANPQLAGTVKDPNGVAVLRARVKAIPEMGMVPVAGGAGNDNSVEVRTNASGEYKMGGFMPGIPYAIVAYPPDPSDGGPGPYAQSASTKLWFSGGGFSFGGVFTGPGGTGGTGVYSPSVAIVTSANSGISSAIGGIINSIASVLGMSTVPARSVAQTPSARTVSDESVQTAYLTLTSPQITGKVTNPSGGTVGGAKVVATDKSGSSYGAISGSQGSSATYEGYSDTNGTYQLGSLTSGKSYSLIANPPASGAGSEFKGSQPKVVSYNGTAVTSGADLALSTTQITVTVSSGGVGVPNSNVNLSNIGSSGSGIFYQGNTDANGQISFGGLADGQYNVQAFPAPDPKYFNLAPAAPQQTKIFNGTASPGALTFNLGAATLTGIAYQSDGSTPATGGVHVEIYKLDYTFHYGVGVNWQGAFAAGGMPPGNYKVQAKASAGGFGGQSQDSDSIARDVTIDADGKPDSSWDGKLVLTKPQVTVHVVDPSGIPPVYPVHISAVQGGEPVGDGTNTDMMSGLGLLGGLADGTYDVGVNLPPMLPYAAPANQSVTVSGGTATPSNLTFQLVSPKKSITGKVIKASGAAVTNAGVHAFREDGSGNADAFVDSTGAYTLKLATGGSWLLVLFPMYGGIGGGKMASLSSVKAMSADLDWIFTEEPRRVEFVSADDQAEVLSNVNFTVGKADSTVTGKVLLEGSSSAPASGTVFVDVRDEAGMGNGAPAAEDGTFLVAVPSGITARVRVFSKDASLSQKGDAPLVNPKADSSVDVGAIYLSQLSTSISGQVIISGSTDANGQAVAVEGIEVVAVKEGGLGFARTTSAAGGVFTLAVGDGDWNVMARPGRGSRYSPKGRPTKVTVSGSAVTGLSLEVQASDGEITAKLTTTAQGVNVSLLYGYGYALDKNNIMVTGAPMERGTFKLMVPSGVTYTVGVNFPPGLEYGASPVTANLVATTTTSVQIPIAVADATIGGSWVDKSGNVVPGLDATVLANGSKGFKTAVVDPETGQYALRVVAGTWILGGKINVAGYVVTPPSNNSVTVNTNQVKFLGASQNFIVEQASGLISGAVKDPSGSGLVARVWAETKPASAAESPKLVASSVSNDSGVYQLNVPAGTYVIRTAVPPEKGFLPPLPVEGTVSATGSLTVNFQFKLPEVTISGNISGPGASSALVTAYSDKGAWSSTTVTTTGAISYTISATTDDVWHLSASSSVSSSVYRSDPITITVGKENVSARSVGSKLRNVQSSQTDMVLKLVTGLSLCGGESATFDSTGMQVVTLCDGTQVTIPSGALATSGDVTVYVIPTEKLTSQPSAQSRLIGYNLKAFDSNNVEIKKFKQNVTLKVPYPDDATLASMGIDESKLKPMYYDTTSGSWVTSEPYTQDTVNNMFIINTDHFTVFAGILTSGATEVGSGTVKIYLPNLPKGLGTGW